jgi:hypothetical protein
MGKILIDPFNASAGRGQLFDLLNAVSSAQLDQDHIRPPTPIGTISRISPDAVDSHFIFRSGVSFLGRTGAENATAPVAGVGPERNQSVQKAYKKHLPRVCSGAATLTVRVVNLKRDWRVG